MGKTCRGDEFVRGVALKVKTTKHPTYVRVYGPEVEPTKDVLHRLAIFRSLNLDELEEAGRPVGHVS